MRPDKSNIYERFRLTYQIHPYKSTEKLNNLAQFRRTGLQRYIEIQWVRPLARGLWQTQFATYDLLPNQLPSITYWRATLRVVYTKLNFEDKDDQIINPYGFMVASYSLAYHGAEGDNESYIDTARRQSANEPF